MLQATDVTTQTRKLCPGYIHREGCFSWQCERFQLADKLADLTERIWANAKYNSQYESFIHDSWKAAAHALTLN
jgi:hypothetical protein